MKRQMTDRELDGFAQKCGEKSIEIVQRTLADAIARVATKIFNERDEKLFELAYAMGVGSGVSTLWGEEWHLKAEAEQQGDSLVLSPGLPNGKKDTTEIIKKIIQDGQ